MIDYQSIVEQLDTDKVIQLMETLGVDSYVRRPGYVIFPTICHNEDASEASMKLYYYENNHLFVCYTECGNMSIFKFLRHYYETRGIDYDWYEDIYKVILDCSNFRPNAQGARAYKSVREQYRRAEHIELPVYSEGVLNIFTKFYPPEWLNDGITPAAMDKFNILYSIPQNKIIIPHYNINNQLVGIRGRALNEWEIENLGKYMPVQIEGQWYSHPLSLNLYGLNKTKDNIKKNGICYLFEAEKSVDIILINDTERSLVAVPDGIHLVTTQCTVEIQLTLGIDITDGNGVRITAITQQCQCARSCFLQYLNALCF